MSISSFLIQAFHFTMLSPIFLKATTSICSCALKPALRIIAMLCKNMRNFASSSSTAFSLTSLELAVILLSSLLTSVLYWSKITLFKVISQAAVLIPFFCFDNFLAVCTFLNALISFLMILIVMWNISMLCIITVLILALFPAMSFVRYNHHVVFNH